MFFLFDLVGGLFGLAIIFVIVGLVLGKMGYQRVTKKKLSPIGLILASAVLGIIVYGG